MTRIAILAMALAGCAPVAVAEDQARPEGEASATQAAGGRCNAEGLESYHGRQADAPTREEARRRSGAKQLRVIGPDTVVTADYREDRLNIDIDAQGRITRLACH